LFAGSIFNIIFVLFCDTIDLAIAVGNIMQYLNNDYMIIEIKIFTVFEKDLKNVSERNCPLRNLKSKKYIS
jgi:hypothetical protein